MLREKEWKVTHNNRDEALLKGIEGFIFTFTLGLFTKMIRVHLHT